MKAELKDYAYERHRHLQPQDYQPRAGHRDGEYYLELHWEANPNDGSPKQLDQLLREEIGRSLLHCCTYYLAPNENHDGSEECGFITGQDWTTACCG